MNTQKGKLYGVGVGPGDPELMTVKAIKTLEKCDVIAAPVTSGKNTAALDIVKKMVYVGDKEILELPFLMMREKKNGTKIITCLQI